MNDVLYRWPSSAAFGRTVPKTKFYEHGNVRTVLREKFVDDIQRITWAYKLADSTIRLVGTAEVPEIQVFTVEAKGVDVTEAVLTAIDNACTSRRFSRPQTTADDPIDSMIRRRRIPC